jgi:hypothetical protein
VKKEKARPGNQQGRSFSISILAGGRKLSASYFEGLLAASGDAEIMGWLILSHNAPARRTQLDGHHPMRRSPTRVRWGSIGLLFLDSRLQMFSARFSRALVGMPRIELINGIRKNQVTCLGVFHGDARVGLRCARNEDRLCPSCFFGVCRSSDDILRRLLVIGDSQWNALLQDGSG